jgi:stage V sporulation protein B
VLRDASLTPLFQISAFIIPGFALASFYFYYYTGLHYFRLQAFLKTFRALARIIFIIGFGYLWGVEGAVSGYIAAPLAVFLVASLYDFFKVSPTLPAAEQGYSLPKKELLTYAWPFTLFLIFYELVLTADLYFVKALLQSDYLTGLYNAAITVGRIPYYLFYALTIILLPAIAKAKTNISAEETQKLIHKTLALIYVLLLPMVSLLFIYSKEVIEFFYGQKYLGAIPAFEIFIFGAGFLTVFYVLAFALHGAGRVMIPMLLSFVGIVILSVLNFQLIPPYGLVGAASAVTATSFLLALIILYFIKQEFKISLQPKLFLLSLGSTIFITALASILNGNHLLFILWGALLFALHLFFLVSQNALHIKDFLLKKQKKGSS